MSRPWLCVLALATVPLSAYAIDGEALLKQVDRNLNPPTYEAYRKIINIEPNGKRREFVMFTVKKDRDKVAMLFLSPATEKGRTTLRLGDNMWLYIPNVGKPVRITSLQSVVGGVFNNADILSVDYSAEYSVERVEDAGAENLLHLKAKNRTVAYDRLRMWVTKKSPQPTKIECVTAAGILVKTLRFKDIKDFGGITRPATVETDSPLQKGYRSTMIFANVKARALKDEVFTLAYMPKLDTLQ